MQQGFLLNQPPLLKHRAVPFAFRIITCPWVLAPLFLDSPYLYLIGPPRWLQCIAHDNGRCGRHSLQTWLHLNFFFRWFHMIEMPIEICRVRLEYLRWPLLNRFQLDLLKLGWLAGQEELRCNS